MTITEIVENINVVYNMIIAEFDLQKLSTKWVPQMFIDEQTQTQKMSVMRC